MTSYDAASIFYSALYLGNGAYEASYVIRSAGPYEVALVLAGEELVMKGHCEPGRAVVAGAALLGDAVLDLEAGVLGWRV
jgi:hypothetical protein